MDNKINFQQLVEQFAKASGMSRNWSEQFVKSFFDIISEKVIEEGLVKVKGLGTFKLVATENRESVNVNTGERIVIEGHQKINFIPESELKEFINQPFSAFETIQLNDEQVEELARMDDESSNSAKEEAATSVSSDSAEQTEVKPVTKPVVLVGPLLPAGGARNGEAHHIHPAFRFIGKVLVWVLSVALALGVVAYAVWPALFVVLFKDVEPNRDGSGMSYTSQFEFEVQPADTINADTVIADTVIADTVVADTVVADTITEIGSFDISETESLASAEQAAVADRTASSGTLVLLASDEMRDLSEITAADTVNYLIVGELEKYVIGNGDTFTKLALKYYGSKKLWPYIAKCNNVDVNKLKAGDVVSIPILVNR
ncbi:MAG: HU family DNA-binding protein [Bacteroidaceae bacterium]|nr:HU family DNA-binding protein [Bacteroidaceae bacterium]